MADSTYVSGNMAVVGYGVDSDSLLQLVNKYFSGMKTGQAVQRSEATFYGGESSTQLHVCPPTHANTHARSYAQLHIYVYIYLYIYV